MAGENKNGGSPGENPEEKRQLRGLYKYVRISEKTLNMIIVGLMAALVACFAIGYSNRGYLVEFDARGGTVVESQKYMYGDLIHVPEPPVREGSEFDGWYLDENLTIPWNLEEDPVTGPMTLYAGWKNAEE